MARRFSLTLNLALTLTLALALSTPNPNQACHTLQLHVHTVARAGGSDRAKGVNPADPSARGDLLVVGCPFAQERLFEHYQVRVRLGARARA